MKYWNKIEEFELKDKYLELHVDCRDFTIVGSEIGIEYSTDVKLKKLIDILKFNKDYCIEKKDVLDILKQMEKYYRDYIDYKDVIIKNRPVKYLHLYEYDNRFVIIADNSPISREELIKNLNK